MRATESFVVLIGALVLATVSGGLVMAQESDASGGYVSADDLAGRDELEDRSYAEVDLQAVAELAGLTLEQAEQRLRLEDATAGWSAYLVDRHPDHFAGLWLPTDEVVVVIAFTSVTDAVRRTVAEFPYPEHLRLETAEHTFAELMKLREDVLAERNAALTSRLGTEAGSYDVSFRPSDNAVTVRYDPGDPASIADPGGFADARVRTEAGSLASTTCSDIDCHPEMLGGLRLVRNSEGRCSTGFSAVRGGQRGVLSAGHCTGLYQGHGFIPGYRLYGQVTDELFNGDVDAQFIDRTSTVSWTERPQVLSDDASGRRLITSSAPFWGYEEGWFVGLSGWRSDITRGYITDLYYDPGGSDYPLAHRDYVRAGYCSQGGDSGGAVWRNNRAMGLASGRISACDAIFTRIAPALQNLNTSLLLG